jgi:signal transduction histidine kinase
VMDVQPKEMPEYKRQQLEILARQAVHLMELELTHKLLSEKIHQVEAQNKALQDIAFIQSHEFRSPVSSIIGLMNIIRDDDYVSPKPYLLMMEEVIEKLDEKIHAVVRSTEIATGAYVN